ncbi:MAG: NHL repeat-containing protein [bacterium]|nr:NHL repeat-containing protein [bacterium]
MKEDLRFRSFSEWATGGSELPLLGRETLLWFFIWLFLSANSLLLAPSVLLAAGEGVVVRNDQAPLKVDHEVGRFGTGRLYFDDPVDIAVHEDGHVYILDAGNCRVQVMSEKGRFETQWGERGEADGYFDEPIALSLNPDGNFLVILDKGTFRINKYDEDGNYQLSFGEEGSRKGMFDDPVDVTIDSQNYIYVADRGRSRILKFHKSGAFIEEWGGRGRPEERLMEPISVAFTDERTGVINVLDAGNKNIVRFGRDGRFIDVIEYPTYLLEEGGNPVKIEAGGDKELFVLDAGGGKLLKLRGYGIWVFQLRSEDVPLRQPGGLAVDEENRILVTDLGKNRIYRFSMEMD